MALGNVKYWAEFTSDQGVDYKIQIYDEDWGGSSYEFTLAEGFKLTYDGRGKERYQGVKGSKLEFTAWVETSVTTFEAFVDGLNQTVQGRYKVRVERDDTGGGYSNYWLGVLIPDLADKEDVASPRAVQFRCTDGLSLLKDIDFDQSVYTTTANKETLQSVLQMLQTFLYTYNPASDFFTSASDSFLFSYVGWYENSMASPNTQASDPLKYTGFYPKAFLTITEDTEKPISAYEALEQLTKLFGARLFQVDGKWRFIQVGVYTESAIYYRRYGYTGTTELGTGDVSSTIFRNFGSTSDGYDIIRLAGGSFGYYPALLNVEATYGEWTTSGLKSDEHTVPAFVNLATTETNAVNLGYVQATAGAGILIDQQVAITMLSGTVSPGLGYWIGTAGLWGGTIPDFNSWIMLKVGSYYYNGTAWTTTQTVFNSHNAYLLWIQPTTGLNYQGNLIGSILTADLPASGDLYYNQTFTLDTHGTLGQTVAPSGGETAMTSVFVREDQTNQAFGASATMNSFLSYTLNGTVDIDRVFGASGTAGEANDKIDLGELRMGDGPTTGSPHWGRLQIWNGSAWLNDGTSNVWQAFGSGTTGNITRILCEQCLAGQRKFTERNKYNLFLSDKVDYRFEQAMKDSAGNIYVPNGYVFDALKDEVKGEWFKAVEDVSGITNATTNNTTNLGPTL